MSLFSVLLVAVGGAFGSVCRYLVGVGAGRLLGTEFPFGTLTVNIVGSFVMGLFIELLAVKFDGSEPLRLFVAVGILGGFTTLSSFSLDTIVLFERGAVTSAVAYVGASIVLSLAALVAGFHIVRAFA